MSRFKRSLCVFIHFSKSEFIPKYVEIYVNELSLHFDDVVFVLNKRVIKSDLTLFNKNITLQLIKNEGYDFGMFYKVIQTIDPNEYSRIACINDSNVLFNKLNPIFSWAETKNYDFWGLIDSYEKPWFSTHINNYHLQSHFIVFNERAIQLLPLFFASIHTEEILKETNLTKLRQNVINSWEIGLSQFMIQNGLSSGSYINSEIYSRKYLSGQKKNIGHLLYPQLIRDGYPLLKKKIIFNRKLKDIFRFQTSWKKLIRLFGNQEWEIDEMMNELIEIKNNSGNQAVTKIKDIWTENYNSLFKKDVA